MLVTSALQKEVEAAAIIAIRNLLAQANGNGLTRIALTFHETREGEIVAVAQGTSKLVANSFPKL